MASSLLEIFVPALHAIPLPDDKTKAQSQVTVVIKGRQQTCKGGIVPANTDKTGKSQFKTSYIEQLPHQFPHSYQNESKQVVLLKLDPLFCVYYRKGLHLYVV